MNYLEFKAYRERVTAQRNVLRLDCMNPFKAMSFVKSKSPTSKEYSSDDVISLWAKTMGVEPYKSMSIACGGVRESLKGLFHLFSSTKKELWLPEDIYPFYWDAAVGAGLKAQSFPTMPDPDLRMLDQASDDSVVVITNPLSPLGRFLNATEIERIKAWLDNSTDRRIIVDTVYSYTRGFDQGSIDIFETGQCYLSHSLSKAWLERGIFGVLLAPESDVQVCNNVLTPPPQSANTCAYDALQQQSNLPEIQQQAFDQEWQRLLPAIREIAPTFQVPATGYFTMIKMNHMEVLEKHQAMVIPATVFGSLNKGLSIVTCLYNINK